MTAAEQLEAMQEHSEPFRRITPAEAARIADQDGATVVDVRSTAEYERTRVEGSALLPVDEVLLRHGELPERGPLLMICRTGVRSALAAEYLAALGFDELRLYNVEGGIKRWIADGLDGVAGDRNVD